MSETRERSTIFKFFYIVLSIVTFPIFAVIYILKHPFWVLFFILLLTGGVAYYPISQGVEISNVVEWYKKKYEDTRLEIVTRAVESGKSQYVPKAILDDVKKVKEELEEEKEESLRVKGENYNAKVVRDDDFEEIAIGVKKKGGFKKKTTEEEVKTEAISEEPKEVVSEEVKAEAVSEEPKEVVSEEVKAEAVSEEPKEVVSEEVKSEAVSEEPKEVVSEEVKAEAVED